jgi:predicted outer membrane protein
MTTTPGTLPGVGTLIPTDTPWAHPTAPGSAAGTNGGASASLDDSQIAAVIQEADKGAIAEAREAIRRTKSDRVRQYAREVLDDHSAADA